MNLILKYQTGNVLDRLNKIAPRKFSYNNFNGGTNNSNTYSAYDKTKQAINKAHEIVENNLKAAKTYAASIGDNPDHVEYNNKGDIIYNSTVLDDLASSPKDVIINYNTFKNLPTLNGKILNMSPSNFISKYPIVQQTAGLLGAIGGAFTPTGGGWKTKALQFGLGYLAGKSLVENPSSLTENASFPGIGIAKNSVSVLKELYNNNKWVKRGILLTPFVNFVDYGVRVAHNTIAEKQKEPQEENFIDIVPIQQPQPVKQQPIKQQTVSNNPDDSIQLHF